MKTFLGAALSLGLIACAASSPRIDPARISELHKGQTTVAEVVRQFGRPSVLSKNPDGTQTALYLHSDGPPGSTAMVPLLAATPVDSVTFYFNTSGVLTDYKRTQAKADLSAPASPGKTTQTGSDKTTTQTSSDKNTQTSTDKNTQAGTDKTPRGNANPSSVPSWLPPSTIENR